MRHRWKTCTRKLCGGNFRPNTLGYVIRNVDFLTVIYPHVCIGIDFFDV